MRYKMRTDVTPIGTAPGFLRVVPRALFGWAQWEPLMFIPLEHVRSLAVSIHTARWGHGVEHPEEGSRLAEGGDMQRGRRGNFRAHDGTGKAGPASHELPSCLCLGQSPPQLGPTPLQGRALVSPRATDGAAQPGSGPCRTPAHAVTQGSG